MKTGDVYRHIATKDLFEVIWIYHDREQCKLERVSGIGSNYILVDPDTLQKYYSLERPGDDEKNKQARFFFGNISKHWKLTPSYGVTFPDLASRYYNIFLSICQINFKTITISRSYKC